MQSLLDQVNILIKMKVGDPYRLEHIKLMLKQKRTVYGSDRAYLDHLIHDYIEEVKTQKKLSKLRGEASFEETPEMFLRAARHAELDLMTGISANVMCGQEGYFGTGFFQVMLDINEMGKLAGSKDLEVEKDIDDMLTVEDGDGVCSTQNITISNNTDLIQSTDMGNVDDDYNPGF